MALYLTTSFLFLIYVQQVIFIALLRVLERQAPSSVQNVWQNQDGLRSQHQRYQIFNNYLLKKTRENVTFLLSLRRHLFSMQKFSLTVVKPFPTNSRLATAIGFCFALDWLKTRQVGYDWLEHILQVVINHAMSLTRNHSCKSVRIEYDFAASRNRRDSIEASLP